MATGKELVRLMECGIWKETLSKHVVWAHIFDRQGVLITSEEAKSEHFCHLRCLLKKGTTEDVSELIGELMQLVASTGSEHMERAHYDCYGFTEVIIS